MKNQLFYLLIVVIGVLSVSGCKKDDNSVPETLKYDYISFGISFDDCLGYCKSSLDISKDKIEFVNRGWQTDGALERIEITENIDPVYWEALVAKIDFEDFASLEPVIGCPDCDGQGAEWIEIMREGEVHRVEFEYGIVPGIVSELEEYLKSYNSVFESEPYQPADFNNRTYIEQNGTVRNFSCSSGCSQFVIEVVSEGKSTYYFDSNLPIQFQKNNLRLECNYVLQYDSTEIYKPTTGTEMDVDFVARNVSIFSAEPL